MIKNKKKRTTSFRRPQFGNFSNSLLSVSLYSISWIAISNCFKWKKSLKCAHIVIEIPSKNCFINFNAVLLYPHFTHHGSSAFHSASCGLFLYTLMIVSISFPNDRKELIKMVEFDKKKKNDEKKFTKSIVSGSLQRKREIGSSLVSLFGWRCLVTWAKTNGIEGARFKSCKGSSVASYVVRNPWSLFWPLYVVTTRKLSNSNLSLKYWNLQF